MQFFLLPNVAQEISNAQYVDMLNDHERNDLYRHAIRVLLAKERRGEQSDANAGAECKVNE
jgi:hypothetical protein